jgi:type IX secretion system PorP/SprF family membrane protein
VAASAGAHAQQDAMYTQYMFNTLAINPAYAGSRQVLSITALNRSQWVGIDGAPETKTLSMHAPVSNNKVGIGLQIFNDKIGITRTTGFFFSYAYRMKTGENSTLSLGLQGGLSSFRADYTSVPLNSNGSGDQSFGQAVSKVLPNFGAGLYFSTRKFYLGLSAPHLLNNTLNQNGIRITKEFIARQYVQVFATAGYSFDLTESLCLKPSLLFKGVRGAPMQLDLSSTLWIKDFVAFGLSYRTNADLAALIELQATPQFRVGYAYDYGVNGLNNYNSGSHEFMLRYEFSRGKDKYLSPRSF